MLTDYQRKCFDARPNLYKVFKRVMSSIRSNRKGDINLVIDFFNMMEEFKIDIIANISDEFAVKFPYGCCKKVITEILQMEQHQLEKLFFEPNSIDLGREINSFISFFEELKKYKNHLNKYDFSILELYAKHVGVIA